MPLPTISVATQWQKLYNVYIVGLQLGYTMKPYFKVAKLDQWDSVWLLNYDLIITAVMWSLREIEKVWFVCVLGGGAKPFFLNQSNLELA